MCCKKSPVSVYAAVAYWCMYRRFVVCGSASSYHRNELTDRFFSEPMLLSLPDLLYNFPLLTSMCDYASVYNSHGLFELFECFVFGLEMSKLACRFVAETCPKHAKRKEGRLSVSSALLAICFVNELYSINTCLVLCLQRHFL